MLAKAEEMEYIDRDGRKQGGAHLVEFDHIAAHEHCDHVEPPDEEHERADFQSEINAVMTKFGVVRGPGGKFVRPAPKAAGRPYPQRPAPKAGARLLPSGSKVRCINCGGQHPTFSARRPESAEISNRAGPAASPGTPPRSAPSDSDLPPLSKLPRTSRMTG